MKDGIHPSGYVPRKPKKQTNADRIRSMSDEELAEFLIKSDCCIANAGKVDCSQAEECGICEKVIRNWLKSEVEESDER